MASRDDEDEGLYELHTEDGRVVSIDPDASAAEIAAELRAIGWQGGAEPAAAPSSASPMPGPDRPHLRGSIEGGSRSSLPTRRAFDHVLIIVFENQFRSYVLENEYMRRLAGQGIDMSRYFGVMHPSQPNYIATIAGELCGVTDDELVDPLLEQRTLVDLIEESPSHLRWKAYMESYVAQAQPWSETLAPADHDPYYVKHNPFASFESIVRDEARWNKIESEAALFSDLLNGTFPELAWFSPNIWNDGHYADGTSEELDPRWKLVDQAAKWLEGFFARLRFPGDRTAEGAATVRTPSRLPPRTLVVVTFDESDFEAPKAHRSSYDGPNQVYTVLLGDMIEPGIESEGYNHYSLLRTIEVNFGLGSLHKNDEGANYFQFLWGRRFAWGWPSATPIERARAVAAQSFHGAVFVVDVDMSGAVSVRTWSDHHWSAPRPLGIFASRVALAATRDELVLVYEDANDRLRVACYDEQRGWVLDDVPLVDEPVQAFTVASFNPEDALIHRGSPVVDANQEIMLVYQTTTGKMASKRWRGGEPPRHVRSVSLAPFCTPGQMTLASLGASLYLVYHNDPVRHQLDVLTYNTEPFNAVEPNYTVDTWAPCSFPVSTFSTVEYRDSAPEPWLRPYLAGAPVVSATLDGVLHLVHPGAHNDALLTETFSVGGLLTPRNAVAAGELPPEAYGTLEEAGWGPQSPIHGTWCPPEGAMALAATAVELVLLFQRVQGGPVELCVGRYAAEPKQE